MRVEEDVPQKNRRDHRWYDERDAYKRRHWVLRRKNGVRFGALSGVRGQSLANFSCSDETASDEDDEEDDILPTSSVSTLLISQCITEAWTVVPAYYLEDYLKAACPDRSRPWQCQLDLLVPASRHLIGFSPTVG
jgi:hypothetical protein